MKSKTPDCSAHVALLDQRYLTACLFIHPLFCYAFAVGLGARAATTGARPSVRAHCKASFWFPWQRRTATEPRSERCSSPIANVCTFNFWKDAFGEEKKNRTRSKPSADSVSICCWADGSNGFFRAHHLTSWVYLRHRGERRLSGLKWNFISLRHELSCVAEPCGITFGASVPIARFDWSVTWKRRSGGVAGQRKSRAHAVALRCQQWWVSELQARCSRAAGHALCGWKQVTVPSGCRLHRLDSGLMLRRPKTRTNF